VDLGKRSMNERKFSNAYMLVYVRKSEIPWLLKEVETSEVPEHLKKRFRREEEEEEEAPFRMLVRIITDRHLARHRGADFVRMEDTLQLKMVRRESVLDLKRVVFEVCGIPVDKQRLWILVQRENRTIRMDRFLDSSEDGDPMESFLSGTARDVKFYVQRDERGVTSETDPEPILPMRGPAESGEIFLSFKFFDPEKQTLKYIGSMLISVTCVLHDLLELIEIKMNLSRENEEALIAFEEVMTLNPKSR
jgi:ubiquitin carboxyl-terminal hydrolase 7